MLSPSQGIAFHDIPDGFEGLFAVPALGLAQVSSVSSCVVSVLKTRAQKLTLNFL